MSTTTPRPRSRLYYVKRTIEACIDGLQNTLYFMEKDDPRRPGMEEAIRLLRREKETTGL